MFKIEILSSTKYSVIGSNNEIKEFTFYTNTNDIIAIIPYDEAGEIPEYASIGEAWIRSGCSKTATSHSIKVVRLSLV